MEKQQCRTNAALLPAVASYAAESDKRNLKPDTLLVANKTGDLFNIQHDVGIFTFRTDAVISSRFSQGPSVIRQASPPSPKSPVSSMMHEISAPRTEHTEKSQRFLRMFVFPVSGR
jgi:hypothetical protein